MVFTCFRVFSKTDGTESETRSQNGKRDTRAKNGKRDTKPRHGNRDTRLKGRREGNGIQAHACRWGVTCGRRRIEAARATFAADVMVNGTACIISACGSRVALSIESATRVMTCYDVLWECGSRVTARYDGCHPMRRLRAAVDLCAETW